MQAVWVPPSSWQRKETALPEESVPVNDKVALTLFVGFTGVDVMFTVGGTGAELTTIASDADLPDALAFRAKDSATASRK